MMCRNLKFQIKFHDLKCGKHKKLFTKELELIIELKEIWSQRMSERFADGRLKKEDLIWLQLLIILLRSGRFIQLPTRQIRNFHLVMTYYFAELKYLAGARELTITNN